MNDEEYFERDIMFMKEALKLAEHGGSEGEVPVGAVVVYKDKVVGWGYNCPISQCDPSAHAEIQALRAASQHFKNYRLVDCDLYVTVEPCTMCAGAIIHSRIRKVFYGTAEPKAGVACSQKTLFSEPYFNHKVEVAGGVLANESRLLLQDFFKRRRKK